MSEIKRVGILFAGGPAPAANSVISSAALAFLKNGVEVVGFLHGYSGLQMYEKGSRELVEGVDYRFLTKENIDGTRNKRGIMIGTARANPGKMIGCRADLKDAQKSAPLRRVYEGLRSLGVDALISIGGDDTLKTANKFYEFQDTLEAGSARIRVVHLPKTIDNDYRGIDFTFGFFTAVHWMGSEVLNLRADAEAANAYYIVECMGRKAGWLSYGVGIAGEAQMIVGVEDIPELMGTKDSSVLNLNVLVDKIVDLMLEREAKDMRFGVIVLAEGLVEHLPEEFLEGTTRDEHGHLSLGDVHLGKLVAKRVAKAYEARTGRGKKVTGVQVGYESRCAPPHAFDVMLGSQLGIGSYYALVEKGLDGHMVSTVGQLELCYVPFSELIDQETLVTEVRFIEPGSDFHKLARLLS